MIKVQLKKPRYIIALAVAVALGFGLGATGWVFGESSHAITPLPSPSEAAKTPRLVKIPDFSPIVKKYGNAIVRISDSDTKIIHGHQGFFNPFPKNSPFFGFFHRLPDYTPPENEITHAIGSGFIISHDGYIVTAGHVVRGMHHIMVTLTNHHAYRAKVVGLSVHYDTALLKINAHDLPIVQLGNSKNLQVGQWLLAIGMPFGLYNTVTQGVVSAMNRSLPHDDQYIPFIQSDVPINPGNSGGPLFNMRGQVVGINDQIYTNDGGYMGLSFSIPIDTAMRAVHAFEQHQKLNFGWLGVELQSVTPRMAQALHLPEPVGALIAQVVPSSPAAKVGLKSGEVIVAYDHHPIYNISTLPPLVGDTPPGRIVAIGVIDHGKSKTLQVQVGEMPQQMLVAADQQSVDIRRLGLRVGTLGPKEQQKLGVDHGVLIQSVYPGPASFIGLRSGMAILSINQLRVTSPEQLAQLVKSLPANTPISMRIRNHHGSIFVVITLPTR